MKKNKPDFNEKEWLTEFRSFQDPNSTTLPKPELSMKILESVKNDLSPAFSKVLTRLIQIQFIAGAITLSVCPQFGVGPIGGGSGLVGFVEQYGHLVCGAFCGAFFLIFAAIFAGLFLSRPERKKISENPLLAFSSVSMISFVLLSLISLMTQQNHHSHELSFILMWFVSGILIGSLTFILVSNLKNKIRSIQLFRY
jgi:hypothetical protein